MLIKLIFFFISILHIHGYRGPTFRSSIMEGNKPILRMPPQNSAEQIDISPEETLEYEPVGMLELRSNIKQLVEELGHKNAKAYIKKLVEDTEDNNNVLLHVEVFRDGVSDIKYKYQMRARNYDYDPLPSDVWSTMKHPIVTPEPDPQWLADLKVFIKELIGRYGRRRLDEYVTPVIKAIQKQHNVLIKDIDGEVYINYVKRSPFHSPWIGKRVETTRKQRGSSSEESDESDTEFRRVTKMPMEDR